jgi:hypothetical protein
MSRKKKDEKCNAENSHACLNEIEQTFLNAKNQRKGNSIEAALHPTSVVKNARVRARAEVPSYAIPMWLGGDRNCYPRRLLPIGGTNNIGSGVRG